MKDITLKKQIEPQLKCCHQEPMLPTYLIDGHLKLRIYDIIANFQYNFKIIHGKSFEKSNDQYY